MRRIAKIVGLALALALVVMPALTGCGGAKNELEGTKWKTTSITTYNGTPYTEYLDYELSFNSDTVSTSPDFQIRGYVSGLGPSYKYKLENGKLTLDAGMDEDPVVVRYDGNVIEIRNPEGDLFHYEKQ